MMAGWFIAIGVVYLIAYMVMLCVFKKNICPCIRYDMTGRSLSAKIFAGFWIGIIILNVYPALIFRIIEIDFEIHKDI